MKWKQRREDDGPLIYELEVRLLRYVIRGGWRLVQGLPRRRRFFYVVFVSKDRSPWQEVGQADRLWEAKHMAEADAEFR